MRTAAARQFQDVTKPDRMRFTDEPRESRVASVQRIILQGWKEIATELDRSLRTVQRWERTLGLPVHRLGSGSSSPVFAFKDELQSWLRSKAVDGTNGNTANSLFLGVGEEPAYDEQAASGIQKPLEGKQPSVLSPLASQPEIINALNAFFALEGERHKPRSCRDCQSPTRFLVGHFWLYGTEKTWQISVPFCPNCDSAVRALLTLSGPQRIS